MIVYKAVKKKRQSRSSELMAWRLLLQHMQKANMEEADS